MKPCVCLLSLIFNLFSAAPILAAPATALAFTPDGKFILSGGHRSLTARPVSNGAVTELIACELPRISALAFSPDGKYLAVAGGAPSEFGAVLLYDWEKRKFIGRFTNFTDLATGVAFNPEATWIAASSADSSATLIPFSPQHTSRTPTILTGHSAAVLGIAWAPGDDLIMTASADRSLKLWSAADGKLLRSFSHHTEPVHTVVFRPGRETNLPVECASASDDATVRIWQPKIGRMVRIIRGHGGPVFTLAYTPDGQALFSAGKEGIIRRLDTESDRILGQWKAHEEPIYRIAISPDGKHLASGDWSGQVRLWKISGGQLLPE